MVIDSYILQFSHFKVFNRLKNLNLTPLAINYHTWNNADKRYEQLTYSKIISLTESVEYVVTPKSKYDRFEFLAGVDEKKIYQNDCVILKKNAKFRQVFGVFDAIASFFDEKEEVSLTESTLKFPMYHLRGEQLSDNEKVWLECRVSVHQSSDSGFNSDDESFKEEVENWKYGNTGYFERSQFIERAKIISTILQQFYSKQDSKLEKKLAQAVDLDLIVAIRPSNLWNSNAKFKEIVSAKELYSMSEDNTPNLINAYLAICSEAAAESGKNVIFFDTNFIENAEFQNEDLFHYLNSSSSTARKLAAKNSIYSKLFQRNRKISNFDGIDYIFIPIHRKSKYGSISLDFHQSKMLVQGNGDQFFEKLAKKLQLYFAQLTEEHWFDTEGLDLLFGDWEIVIDDYDATQFNSKLVLFSRAKLLLLDQTCLIKETLRYTRTMVINEVLSSCVNLPIGSLRIQDFELRLELGKGMFGTVIGAEYQSDSYNLKRGSMVAIKAACKKDIIDSGTLVDGNPVDLLNEQYVLKLSTLARFAGLCRNLCTFYGSWKDGQRLYLATEYLPNGTLESVVRNYWKSLKTEKDSFALFYGTEIAKGISFLHSRGILHRDLKLDNVVLDQENHARLIDFGMSVRDIDSNLARSLCGTPTYIAPEVVICYRYRLDKNPI